jgi:broad specificity phosphatase PhoE
MTRVRVARVAFLLMAAVGRVASAADPQAIFIVRHAERAPDAPAAGADRSMMAPANDPPLSQPGRERAAKLASMLRSADIKGIYVTEFQRTRQTAEPLAKALGIGAVVTRGNDVDGLMAKLREAKGNLLIVGHSNTIPDILKRLGVKGDITIADSEYDNLFVVVRPDGGEPSLIRLRF